MLNAFVIVQIYKKGNRRQNSGWLMLDKVCSWSNYLFNFFWFIQPDFQVGCIWVQFHPTSGSSSMRWVQNICGGLCFKRFYWHLNVSNLWRATKSQKIKRPQTRQARRVWKKKCKCKKRLDRRRDFIAYLRAWSKLLFMERVSHWLYQLWDERDSIHGNRDIIGHKYSLNKN